MNMVTCILTWIKVASLVLVGILGDAILDD